MKHPSLWDKMLVHLGLLVVRLPSSSLREQDVGPWVPVVQKANFGGKCLKPFLLQVLGEVQGCLSPLGVGEHLSGAGRGDVLWLWLLWGFLAGAAPGLILHWGSVLPCLPAL